MTLSAQIAIHRKQESNSRITPAQIRAGVLKSPDAEWRAGTCSASVE